MKLVIKRRMHTKDRNRFKRHRYARQEAWHDAKGASEVEWHVASKLKHKNRLFKKQQKRRRERAEGDQVEIYRKRQWRRKTGWLEQTREGEENAVPKTITTKKRLHVCSRLSVRSKVATGLPQTHEKTIMERQYPKFQNSGAQKRAHLVAPATEP